ncbi:MAG: FGGY family carbohydrate kinase [Haloplanus sp.]
MPTREYVIGVDAGTTGIKAAAVDRRGVVREHASRPTPRTRPNDGWQEQDPEETWTRTAAAVGDVLDATAGDPVAVGVVGQGGGCWLVDGDGDPVRNAILWSDGRAGDAVSAWGARGVADRVFELTGYRLFAGLMAPILDWLDANEPQALDRADAAYACKDWLRHRLTGVPGTDTTDASLGCWTAPQGKRATDVADALDCPRLVSLAPDEIREPTDVVGHVTPTAAADTGLPEGIPVVAGAMDVGGAALGSGAFGVDDVSVLFGTTLQTQTITPDTSVRGPQTGYTLDLGDGTGLRAIGAMAGTPNLDWVTDLFDADIEAAEAAARSVPVGAEGVLYHPYLSTAGEKAPFVDPDARAQFTGLDPTHTEAHLVRAVYEGVAFGARDCLSLLPGSVDPVTLAGGGSRSPFWRQVLADCLDAPVRVADTDTPGVRGGAAFAYAGVDDSTPRDVVASWPARESRTSPRPDRTRRYDERFEEYVAVRDAMREVWRRR